MLSGNTGDTGGESISGDPEISAGKAIIILHRLTFL